MKEHSYGAREQTSVSDEISQQIEEITVRGFTIVSGLYSPEELEGWRQKIDAVYAAQEKEFGREALAAIQELDVCRAPLLYDFDFIALATHPKLLPLVKHFLGDWFILNLQNAIINRPGTEHHQSAWHRDLPYQNYVISRPLAINTLLAIDDFSVKTGGTNILPFTHKVETLPSEVYIEHNRLVAEAPAGSAIVFDAMLFHKAGANRSSMIRRAVNHLYTTPIIKQQYDFPRALSGMKEQLDPSLERLLGFTSPVPPDDRAWRKARASRLLGKPQ